MLWHEVQLSATGHGHAMSWRDAVSLIPAESFTFGQYTPLLKRNGCQPTLLVCAHRAKGEQNPPPAAQLHPLKGEEWKRLGQLCHNLLPQWSGRERKSWGETHLPFSVLLVSRGGSPLPEPTGSRAGSPGQSGCS